MTSSRPYLLRAFIEWILDNNLTPYLVVNAEHEGAQVPTRFVEDGRIVLNISPMAIRDYHLENTHIAFSARFTGNVEHVYVPMNAVLAIYAKENGRGMVFKDDESDYDPEPGDDDNTAFEGDGDESNASQKGGKGDSKKSKGAGFLKVIK